MLKTFHPQYRSIYFHSKVKLSNEFSIWLRKKRTLSNIEVKTSLKRRTGIKFNLSLLLPIKSWLISGIAASLLMKRQLSNEAFRAGKNVPQKLYRWIQTHFIISVTIRLLVSVNIYFEGRFHAMVKFQTRCTQNKQITTLRVLTS